MLPTWNLKDLFPAKNHSSLPAAKRRSLAQAEKFAKRHRGKVASLTVRPQSLEKALAELEKIGTDAAKPMIYAGLIFAEDASKPENGALYQSAQEFGTALDTKLMFFELELMELSSSQLAKLAKQKNLKNYQNYFTKLALRRKHKLPEEQEALLSETNLTGRSAFVRLFDMEFAHKRFQVKGVKKDLTESAVLHLLSDPKRSVRKAAMQGLVDGLKADSWRLTYIFNNLSASKQMVDRRRGYALPESARHLDNETDQVSVDAMTDVLRSSYSVVQRYYKLKGRLLGLGKLELYDRYAPLPTATSEYSFKRAKSLVLDSFNEFSPKFAAHAESFFSKNWIDAAKRPGKRGGAFCTYVTPDLHPYVFMNFEGSLRDVFTLAHELGHAVHACLMQDQSYLNFDSPLTIAESASTFAEMLVFDRMRADVKSKSELVALLMFKIDSIIATVYRQISMYLFERDFHAERTLGSELTAERISEIWQHRQKELYCNSINLGSGSELLWSYIPHFVHTPFYVYAYSFGELLALTFFARYKKSPKEFPQQLMDYFALGCSVNPKAALSQIGIKISNPAVWQQGVGMLDNLVADLVKAAK